MLVITRWCSKICRRTSAKAHSAWVRRMAHPSRGPMWERVFSLGKSRRQIVVTVHVDPETRKIITQYLVFGLDTDEMPRIPKQVRREAQAFTRALSQSA